MYFIFLFSLYKGAWTGLEYEYAQLCLNQSMVSTALSGIDSHFILCLRVCSFISVFFRDVWFYTALTFFYLRFFCSHCTFSGLVLTDTREKYDGTRRSPWNEIECGDHYVRPMAAFTFFEFASGQVRSTSLSVALNYDIDIQCLCCNLLLLCVGVLCALFFPAWWLLKKSFQAPYGDTSICLGIFHKKKNDVCQGDCVSLYWRHDVTSPELSWVNQDYCDLKLIRIRWYGLKMWLASNFSIQDHPWITH